MLALWLKQKKYHFQIEILRAFRPAIFFKKVNELSWYHKTLCEWVDNQGFSFKSKILEVGSATGSLCAHLEESGYLSVGVDASEKMVKTAKLTDQDINCLVANAYSLPFADNEFDVVVSSSLLNIVLNKQRVINEMVRICKDKGIVSILVPIYGFNDENLESLVSSIGVSGFSEAILRTWHSKAPKMYIHDLEELFAKANLTIVSSTSYLHGMVFSISAVKVM